MTAALHIVHPYVYQFSKEAQLEGRVGVLGSADPTRDTAISSLVNKALQENVSVVRHECVWADGGRDAVSEAMLRANYTLDVLFDPAITEVYTMDNGLLLADHRPSTILEEDWHALENILTTEREYRVLTEHDEPTLFIRGLLEACMRNAMTYHKKIIAQERPVHYIPELSVCLGLRKWAKAQQDLERFGVTPVSAEEAMEMLLGNRS